MSLLAAKRKNRNIKGLQIAQDAPKTQTSQSTSAPKVIAVSNSTSKRSNNTASTSSRGSWHSSDSASSSPSLPSSAFSSASSTNKLASKLTDQLANLELGIEFKLDLRAEDLELVNELGAGNGGTVSRVRHIPTGAIMARKVVHIDAKPSVRKQIVRELQIMHDCSSKYIVSFYGAYLNDPQICMCMEMMDRGSLDNIYKSTGPIPIVVLGKIAVAVVSGLTYLYDVHRIIHRDVKPSNVLVNSAGHIKICDFGVSGELINSVADTFVGTSTYMSPERIQGAAYTVRSDVWSLGIMLIELALGRFPFSSDDSDDDVDADDATLSPVRPAAREKSLAQADARRAERRSVVVNGGSLSTQAPPSKPKKQRPPKQQNSMGGMSILELLQHVVNEPAPTLTPHDQYPADVHQFVNACLEKDVTKRPTPKELTRSLWFVRADKTEADLEQWASGI